MKKQLLLFVVMLLPMVASAYDIEVQDADGVTIYYNYKYINGSTELEVTFCSSAKYTGNVVIPEEVTYMNKTCKVTSIGDYAFSGCSGLTSITIPNSVTSIGYRAFGGCSGLTSVTIPNSVTIIGSSAFSSCYGLTSITIPNSVTSIGSFAFWWCCGLTSIAIPNSVTSIGERAFENCSSLASITIPNSVTSIGYMTFWECSSLTSITIPNSVTTIGERAFYGCSSLTSVTIPNSVTSIGESAFRNCSSLTSITIPNSVTTIGSSLFYGCTSLISVVIPSSVVLIEENAFNECTSLNELVFDDGEDTLQFSTQYQVSYSKPNWFLNCPLDSIYIGRDMEYSYVTTDYHQTTSHSPFRENETLRVVKFSNNTTNLQDGYFVECTNLTSVYLSDNLKSIGSSAFENCSRLQSIEFNFKLDSISYSAFNGCRSLKKIVIPSNVRTIEKNAFANTNLSELIIEEGDKDIDKLELSQYTFTGASIDYVYWGRNGAAINYKKIKHLEIGNISNFRKVGAIFGSYSSYKGCDTINVLSIRYSSDTLHFVVEDEVDYSRWTYNYTLPFKDIHIDSIYCDRIIDVYDSYNTGRTFYPFEGVNSSFKLTIGNSITDISNNMFAGCNIPSVLIPKNIIKIGNSCFSGCVNLRTVNIEDSGESLEIGDEQTFYQCSIDSIYLGRNLVYNYDKTPFPSSKERLKKLTMGNCVTEINNYMFTGFKSLLSINLPKNLTKIGKQAFYGCEGLTELTIPSSVTEIGRQAFDLCRGLKTLTLEDGEEELTFTAESNYINNAFTNSPLEDIYLGRNFSFTGNSPLSLFETLKSITIGEDVSSLSEKSFIGCPNLKDVTSYSKVVPAANGVVFTPTYQTDATLHVPFSLYNEYKVANVWKDFGTIVNFEGLYNLVYNVDGEEYKKYVVEQGTAITPEAEPTMEGFTFSGWCEIPETMPAHDVTITGTFNINSYKLTYMIDDQVYKETMYEYGATIVPEPQPEGNYETFEWVGLPQTMPAHDVVVNASYTITGIIEMLMSQQQHIRIYSPNGKMLDKPQKGLNIIQYSDGKTKKIVVK